MKSIEQKLQVLSVIAHRLNESKIPWAVGASLLLFFKGIVSDFHDIDIMLCDKDVEKLKELLLLIGTLAPPNPNKQYILDVV